MNYKCLLMDRDSGDAHVLGIYEADTGEAARDKAEADYRNLIRKLSTGKWELMVRETGEPASRPMKRPRTKAKTIDILGEGANTRTTKEKARMLMRYKGVKE